jgi:hypothetical protein
VRGYDFSKRFTRLPSQFSRRAGVPDVLPLN